MADQGSQGKAIPAPVKGANEAGRPVDSDSKNGAGCACAPVYTPPGPGNNVKPR